MDILRKIQIENEILQKEYNCLVDKYNALNCNFDEYKKKNEIIPFILRIEEIQTINKSVSNDIVNYGYNNNNDNNNDNNDKKKILKKVYHRYNNNNNTKFHINRIPIFKNPKSLFHQIIHRKRI
jgi:predicted nuclease with TOPRIM domain